MLVATKPYGLSMYFLAVGVVSGVSKGGNSGIGLQNATHFRWLRALISMVGFPGRNNGRNFSGIRALTVVKISHRSRYLPEK